jgi:hypothetical protein
MDLRDKLIKTAPIAITSLFLTGVAIWRVDELRLGKKDFEKAEWIEYKNSNGKLWNSYVNEKTKRYMGSGNWERYQYFVNEKNNGKLHGKIYLPDLDCDGKVGN